MEMFLLIGIPVIVMVWLFLFWTVFLSSISPIRNGAGNRLSDIVLVGAKDARRCLKFQKEETSLKLGDEFKLITYSRTAWSKSGERKPQAIIFSGKKTRPYYILMVPFLGSLCKLVGFGFYWEHKGWGLGGLNFARLFIPTLGDENDEQGQNQAITVKFCEDGIGLGTDCCGWGKKETPPEGTIATGNLVVVDYNRKDFGSFWKKRILHCVHYDEKGASVYIMYAWRTKLLHPFRRPLPISRFSHGARWMMNADSTISPLKNPDLVLGVHPNMKYARQSPTPTSETLGQCFGAREDLLQYSKVFDDHCITQNQLKDLTYETLFRDMKIPLGHALDMPALLQKPILHSEKPSQSLPPHADLIFPMLGSPVVGEFGPRTFQPTALLGTPSTMMPPPPGMLDLYMCDVKDRLACSIEYIYSVTPPYLLCSSLCSSQHRLCSSLFSSLLTCIQRD
jgi:hypothetical protein